MSQRVRFRLNALNRSASMFRLVMAILAYLLESGRYLRLFRFISCLRLL
jgi:hypothetical protein